MAIEGRQEFAYGDLNPIEPPIIRRRSAPTSAINALERSVQDSQTLDSLNNTGAFKAVVLRVEPEANGASWLSWAFSDDPPNLVRIRARIPELHAMLPEPNELEAREGEDARIIEMYPIFEAQSEDIEAPNAGDIVWVDYTNKVNVTGPIYLGPVQGQPDGNTNNLKADGPGGYTKLDGKFVGIKGVGNQILNSIFPDDPDFVPLQGVNMSVEFQRYIWNLDRQFDKVSSQLFKDWPVTRVKEEAIKVCKRLGIEDPGAFWTVIMTEATGRPVGVYGNNWESAVKAHSSAYGIGQNTRNSNWKYMQEKYPDIAGKIPHDQLYLPENGILACGLYWRHIEKYTKANGGYDLLTSRFKAYTGRWNTAQDKKTAYTTWSKDINVA